MGTEPLLPRDLGWVASLNRSFPSPQLPRCVPTVGPWHSLVPPLEDQPREFHWLPGPPPSNRCANITSRRGPPDHPHPGGPDPSHSALFFPVAISPSNIPPGVPHSDVCRLPCPNTSSTTAGILSLCPQLEAQHLERSLAQRKASKNTTEEEAPATKLQQRSLGGPRNPFQAFSPNEEPKICTHRHRHTHRHLTLTAQCGGHRGTGR